MDTSHGTKVLRISASRSCASSGNVLAAVASCIARAMAASSAPCSLPERS